MGLFEVTMLFLAGVAAGTINTVVGSGSLVSFPALLAFGYSPLTANMTNIVGVLPGSASGAFAYRKELSTQWPRVLRLASFSMVGAIGGSFLLLHLPPAAFKRIVPVLVLFALVLFIFQPWLKKRTEHRATKQRTTALVRDIGIFLTGVYGGYFGAAQGVILMSLLGMVIDDTIQRLNSIKLVLALSANAAAAIIFIWHGGIHWPAAGCIAVGALVGGQVGARIGKRLPTPIYRGVIITVGLVAFFKLILS